MPHDPRLTRRRVVGSAAAAAAIGIAGCSSGGDAPPATATRSWRMGFSGLPPRNTFADAIRTIDTWSPRADLAAIHEELPWAELLAGTSADAILQRDKVGLVDYYRSKGHQLMVMIDLTDGLSRAQEAPQLRTLGRSLAEPAVQQAARSYALAVNRLLRPEVLGLAAETNLIRAAAPATLYNAVRQCANAMASDLRAAGTQATLLASVQVETAWGRLGGNGPYVGIATDRADFAFMQMLGLSSYPYFGHAVPEDIPADYYSRLLAGGAALPVMVVEGGWASAGASAGGSTIVSSPALQARYVARHAALLDGIAARGVIQLVFADIDLAAFPPPLPANLPLFATLGFVDSNYAAKPALAQWDALFARAR